MSAKTSTQPGRRTPLSLTGAVPKNNPNKSGSNASNGSGNNANGHTTSTTNKTENKLQQQRNEIQINNTDNKEISNKRQQPQADKKQHQNDNKKSNEKNQNGVNNNKQHQFIENKQQQNKEKQQQQNGNEENKVNEKDKKEKSEKSDKNDKHQDKSEKQDIKLKEDKKVEQEKPDNKKEEKTKDIKDAREDKMEITNKNDVKTEQHQQIKNVDKKSKDDNQIKISGQKSEEKTENIKAEKQQTQQKPVPSTPKSNSKSNKSSTPGSKTPTRDGETTPQKSNSVKNIFLTKREVTTTVDDNDVEMEQLAIESSPIKSLQTGEATNNNVAPSATSTPGKIILPKHNSGVPKSDVQLAMQSGYSLERPRAFSQISGRRSIRPISDFTPSKFQSNLQYRESYRRINTELDATNTSMNVTVGSEAPNNISFSFFGRGRKRDRTSPRQSQSAIGELQTDMEVSPPKRARLDIHGFFSVVSSPLSMLRNRFSKASLKCSTPVKFDQKLNTAEDEVEVQNVSGVSVHEEISKSDKEESAETNTTVNDNNDISLGEDVLEADFEEKGSKVVPLKCEKICAIEQTSVELNIKATEVPLQASVGDIMDKNKRCIVM